MEKESQLVRLCIEAACQSRESVEKWRRQRRSLERLPSQLADSLLRCLLARRLLFPSLLERENSVDMEWMAYIGAFRYLRSLNIADCRRITSSALWAITGMTTLKELDLSRCMKINDSGIRHIVSISSLEKLCISETGLTADGVRLLSSLRNLSVLDLGGLPVTDQALNSLRVLTKLQYLDLWGSEISDQGASIFQVFPKLSFLNVAWTNLRKLPNLSSLECLDMSYCTIESILKGYGDKAPLTKLLVSGATFMDDAETLIYIETSFLSYLDISKSSLHRFSFLPCLKVLEHLDLSSSMMEDDLVEEITCIGANLRYLNLSKTRVGSAGVGVLAGHLPNLEILLLSHTSIDDVAISYISMMPSLKDIDLSSTHIKGIIHQVGCEMDPVLSLTSLQSLTHLERLNLEHTLVRDAALDTISSFHELTYLSLNGVSLTDISLHSTSSIPKLTNLTINNAVVTNLGLVSFKPPATLRMIDLQGCWLLTEDAIVSFSRSHPQIEVRHEHAHIIPSQHISSNRPSPSRSTWKNSQLNQEQKIPVSPSFIDQRLKYRREELLSLQYSSSSLASPHDSDITKRSIQ
nr:chaoptin isoform X2 [Ziziphus jujuba var. spinosa]